MKTRVLVVDDSPLIRAVLREAFEQTSDLEVVGEAVDGHDAVAKVQELGPDIVTMDVLMPNMDGLAATDEIMRVRPTPILVIARDSGDAHTLAMAALGHGALAVYPKPAKGFDQAAALELAKLVRTLARERAPASEAKATHAFEPDKIRVLVVDDSSLVRQLLRDELERVPDIEVVGEAADGVTAVALASELQPDVVTLDLVMPMMGGHETAQEILHRANPGILIVAQDRLDASRLLQTHGGNASIGIFLKPGSGPGDANPDDLASAIRRLAEQARSSPARRRHSPRRWDAHGPHRPSLLGIVGSTGAVRVLGDLLAELPTDFPLPIALVQHTERGFTERLAAWLASVATLPVRLASAGHRLMPGEIVLAPDDLHMEVHTGGFVRLISGEPVDNFRPSGTVLLRSLARSYGAHAAGLVLSGMGSDGADGLAAIVATGGGAIVEHPQTAAVPGMPTQALERAHGALALPAPRLGSSLVELVSGNYGNRA